MKKTFAAYACIATLSAGAASAGGMSDPVVVPEVEPAVIEEQTRDDSEATQNAMKWLTLITIIALGSTGI
ncbi:hypothetical protein [Roseovarius salinarum]|uniref:hypothetical protein n=1 Tax=Roseovarius salinarum TaxID=1981892 RepID=UPI0012FFE0A7|nr:hypothetical protein [Roseovarius salinarum]